LIIIIVIINNDFRFSIIYGIYIYIDFDYSPDKSQAEVDYLKKDLKQLRLEMKTKDEEILMLKYKQTHKMI